MALLALLVPGIARRYKPAPNLNCYPTKLETSFYSRRPPIRDRVGSWSDIPNHPSNEGFYFSVCSDQAAALGVEPPPLVRVTRGRRWCITVTSVTEDSSTNPTSRSTYELTRARNHLGASTALKRSDRRPIYWNICLFIRESPETSTVKMRRLVVAVTF